MRALYDHLSNATPETSSRIAASLAELRLEIARIGCVRRPTGRILLELACHVACMLGGAALFLASSRFAVEALGVLLSAWGCIGIASNSHTSSHYATSASRRINEALTFFGYSFCLGLSALFWWSDHAEHHAAPNVPGRDDDFDYAPIFSVDAAVVEQAGPPRRWYYGNLQRFLLPPALFFMGFNLQRRGVGWLWQNRGRARQRWWIDVLLLAAHAAVFLVLPARLFGITPVIEFYTLRMFILGWGLFAILAPAHFPQEAALVAPEMADGLGYAELQTITTVNYSGGRLLAWISSGLGYQIEHHLFPGVGHPHYARISPLIQDFCRRNHLPYRSYPFAEALGRSWHVFRHPKRALVRHL